MKLKKIKLNKIQLKNYFFKFLDKINLITFLVAGLLIIFVFIFLYKNFYRTFTSAQKITVLQEEIAANKIDEKGLEKIEQNLINKMSITENSWNDLIHIFSQNTKNTANPNELENFSPKSSF